LNPTTDLIDGIQVPPLNFMESRTAIPSMKEQSDDETVSHLGFYAKRKAQRDSAEEAQSSSRCAKAVS
jgi:CMP-2-keto-3-deoxyoctulosonic acid synthetase